MHVALWKLYRLRIRGSVRAMIGRIQSIRGAVLAAFTMLVVLMMFGPNLLFLIMHGPSRVMAHGPNSLDEILPVGMLLYFVLAIGSSLGQRAIYFSPAEVDFLFPGPFSRRQMLLYKILGNVSGAILMALILATSLVMFIASWPAAVIGAFLAVLWINSLTLCVQLIAQSVSERVFTRARKWFLLGIAATVALAIGRAGRTTLDSNWQETLRAARHSGFADVLLAPFGIYANIIAAERLVPDALGWTALGAILAAAGYAVAIRLDANYLETAVRVSQQIQERVRRASSDGIFARSSHRAVRTSKLPQPPWLGGVGPLAWRQTLQAVRGGRGGMLLAVIVFAAVATPVFLGSRKNADLPAVLPSLVIGAAVYITFLFSAHVPLGFRGDHARMDLLKSLPIRPPAIACGQMVVVALVLTCFQCFLFGVTAAVFPASAAQLLIASAFALPFNWILFGTEDFLFLLYPSPMIVTGSEGLLKMGRVMLFMLAKFLVLGACAAAAAVPATVVYFVTDSLALACSAGLGVLAATGVGILMLVAWAFSRFDVAAMAEQI